MFLWNIYNHLWDYIVSYPTPHYASSPLWKSETKNLKCKWQKCRSFRSGKLNFWIDYVFINTESNVMVLSTICMLLFLLLLKWNNKEEGISILLSQPLFL
jgi:hypothetical protein